MSMYVQILLIGAFMFLFFIMGGFIVFKLKFISIQDLKELVKIKSIACGLTVLIMWFGYYIITLVSN